MDNDGIGAATVLQTCLLAAYCNSDARVRRAAARTFEARVLSKSSTAGLLLLDAHREICKQGDLGSFEVDIAHRLPQQDELTLQDVVRSIQSDGQLAPWQQSGAALEFTPTARPQQGRQPLYEEHVRHLSFPDNGARFHRVDALNGYKADERLRHACQGKDCVRPGAMRHANASGLAGQGPDRSKTEGHVQGAACRSHSAAGAADAAFVSAGSLLAKGRKRQDDGEAAASHWSHDQCAGGAPGHAKKRLGWQPPKNGFVPPFINKAVGLEQHGAASVGQQAGTQGAGGAGGEKNAYSDEATNLLAQPDGSMPEGIMGIDPQIVNTVCGEVLHAGGAIQWDDIAGQSQAKQLVQELVVWPMMNPSLFRGARSPPKGLLLFGPPGTGKTLIGKAIASNIRATFFSISASSLTSKWIGESEKLVRALFRIAEVTQPSVIFIDEIDSILSARRSDGEHEASRRLKTELLVQMDGCDPRDAQRRVLLIGATNRPEELDEAARRRMPKQLYIPLPCADARRELIKRQVGPQACVRAHLAPAEVEKIVAKTAGYSGSDMKILIQEACQGPVRDAVAHHGAAGSNNTNADVNAFSEIRRAVSDLREDDLRPVLLRDFRCAAHVQKASVHESEIQRYIEYDKQHGARNVTQVDIADDDW